LHVLTYYVGVALGRPRLTARMQLFAQALIG
jgi:hypothetical protein